jgi:hypothetical protein
MRPISTSQNLDQSIGSLPYDRMLAGRYYVSDVSPAGPIAKAGIAVDDVLTKIDERMCWAGRWAKQARSWCCPSFFVHTRSAPTIRPTSSKSNVFHDAHSSNALAHSTNPPPRIHQLPYQHQRDPRIVGQPTSSTATTLRAAQPEQHGGPSGVLTRKLGVCREGGAYRAPCVSLGKADPAIREALGRGIQLASVSPVF